MKIAVVDFRMRDSIRKDIEIAGYRTVSSFDNGNVYNALRGHVDISMFFHGNTVICAPESYRHYLYSFISCCIEDRNKSVSGLDEYLRGLRDIIFREDIKPDDVRGYIEDVSGQEDIKTGAERSQIGKLTLIKGDTALEKKYPGDIRYNACVVGNRVICRYSETDGAVRRYIGENSMEVTDINQGYANCSICVVDDSSIITYDRGIYSSLKDSNLDILLIEEGNIALFDMNHGFIGGASSLMGKDRLCFFGKADRHPDYEKIRKFTEERGKYIVELGEGTLTDYGKTALLEI